jgi:hypothetical protein
MEQPACLSDSGCSASRTGLATAHAGSAAPLSGRDCDAGGLAADGISPEQAVDEAIARIKQILSE